MPLPRDATLIRETRSEAGPIRFLLMCRLTVEKGIRVAIQAVSRLPGDLPFELVIAGRGPLEPEVRAAAANDSRISFAGYVGGEAKVALLASAHHLLVPSLWYENAPLAVIEAAAYGLGLLGSRIGGISELVREGRTGLLFEPGDDAALAEAMLGLTTGAIGLRGQSESSWDLARSHTVERMVDDSSPLTTACWTRARTAGGVIPSPRRASMRRTLSRLALGAVLFGWLVPGAVMPGLSSAAPGRAQAAECGADCVSFPPDSGVVNVRSFGARGDGQTDDTAAPVAPRHPTGV